MDTRRTDLREAIERLYEMTTLAQTDSSEFEQLDHFIQQRLLDTYADVPDVALRVVACHTQSGRARLGARALPDQSLR